jgi:Mg2+ and Co2+ transporter CorA
VRSGFTEAEARDLRERLNPFIRKDSPLSEPINKPKATWVEPVLEVPRSDSRTGKTTSSNAIVDFIVDNYLAVVGPLAEEVEALEERILTPPLDETKNARIYDLRRELQKLRLVVGPTAEVCQRLAHLELPGIDPAFRPYFRDIVDHVNRVLEQIDTLRARC